MRAKEFLSESDSGKTVTINIPITITIPSGNGDPVVGAGTAAPATPGKNLPHEPLMISPLQQELELLKQQGGKRSKIINQIVTDNGAHSDDDEEGDLKENKQYDINEDFDKLDAEFQQISESQK